MPVQCLIRKLTSAQVEKSIIDNRMQGRLAVQDYNGMMLLAVSTTAEGGDPEANTVLQTIADADSEIIWLERANIEAAEAAASASRLVNKP
jgi:hypothetical protein